MTIVEAIPLILLGSSVSLIGTQASFKYAMERKYALCAFTYMFSMLLGGFIMIAGFL